jgi:hypothetical protein
VGQVWTSGPFALLAPAGSFGEAERGVGAGKKMKRNMLTRRAGSLVLLRQNTEEPTDQDWAEFLRLLASQRKEVSAPSLRILVYTDGGAVSSDQRKRLAETLGDFHPKVACVSNSVKVRFAGAMIALFQRNYRQFSVAEMKHAFTHLELSPVQRESAEAILYELEAMLYADL